jgi:adenylate kinase
METILRRLEVYKASAKPVEEFYQDKGLLLDFEIKGGIPETLPVLMEALKPYSNTLSDIKAETA